MLKHNKDTGFIIVSINADPDYDLPVNIREIAYVGAWTYGTSEQISKYAKIYTITGRQLITNHSQIEINQTLLSMLQ